MLLAFFVVLEVDPFISRVIIIKLSYQNLRPFNGCHIQNLAFILFFGLHLSMLFFRIKLSIWGAESSPCVNRFSFIHVFLNFCSVLLNFIIYLISKSQFIDWHSPKMSLNSIFMESFGLHCTNIFS